MASSFPDFLAQCADASSSRVAPFDKFDSPIHRHYLICKFMARIWPLPKSAANS